MTGIPLSDTSATRVGVITAWRSGVLQLVGACPPGMVPWAA